MDLLQIEQVYKFVTGVSRPFFCQPKGWFVSIALISAVAFFYAPQQIPNTDIELDIPSRILISILFGIIGAVIANIISRPPIFKKNSVGIYLHIEAESAEEKNRAKNDVMPKFHEIMSANDEVEFDVKLLPNQFHNEINKTRTRTAKFLKRNNAILLIDGNMRKRRIRGEEHYIWTVNSLLRHGSSNKNHSALLEEELTGVISGRRTIDCQDELAGLELTSSQIAYGAKYAIGFATLISGHPEIAQNILSELHETLTHQPAKSGHISILKRMSANRILNCVNIRVEILYSKWRRDQKTTHIIEALEIINSCTVEWRNSPPILLIRAAFYFLKDRNVNASLGLLTKATTVAGDQIDVATKYLQAILLAYQEDFTRANKIYRELFSTNPIRSSIMEIDDFFHWLLQVEPDKVQFHYYSALVDFRFKGDAVTSAKELMQFFEKDGESKYPQLAPNARQLLSEATSNQRNSMNLSNTNHCSKGT